MTCIVQHIKSTKIILFGFYIYIIISIFPNKNKNNNFGDENLLQ